MVVELPAPIKGSTHIRVDLIVEMPGYSVRTVFWGGTLDPSGGTFLPDPDLREQEVVIMGERYAQLYIYAESRGAGPGEWRKDDLLKFNWALEAHRRGIPVDLGVYPNLQDDGRED
jgi:hypothetical protein